MATNSLCMRGVRWMIALSALLFVGVSPAHAQELNPQGAAPRATAPRAAVLAKASAKRGPIVAEQRKHLRRLTKLNQLMVVARQQGNDELASRVDDLTKKEKERHIKQLMQLKIGKKILMAPPRLPAPAKEQNSR